MAIRGLVKGGNVGEKFLRNRLPLKTWLLPTISQKLVLKALMFA